MLEMKGVNIAPVGPPAELNVLNDYKLMTEGIRIARLEGLVDKLLREVDPKGVNIGPAGLLPPASEHSVESENNKVTSEGSRIVHLEALVENLVREVDTHRASIQSLQDALHDALHNGNAGAEEEEKGRHESEISFAQSPEEGAKSDTVIEEFEVSIGETVWDAALVCGLPPLDCGASVLLLLSLILNSVIQILFSVAVYVDDSFSSTSTFLDLVPQMARWRLTEGHDHLKMDLTDTSLVSRVCNSDGSLSIAGNQMSIIDQIKSYLKLEPEVYRNDLNLEEPGSKMQFLWKARGPRLCGLCILLWTLVVFQELRSVATLVHGVLKIPRGPTRLNKGSFVAVSSQRVAGFLGLMGIRTVLAVVLLWSGILWLSHTSSMTDLILNAAALGFIMDTDELLFAATTPAIVKNFVSRLEPLSYPARSLASRMNASAVLALCSLLAVLVFAMTTFVFPNITTMLILKDAVCAGNQEFVAGMSATEVVTIRRTNPISKRKAAEVVEDTIRIDEEWLKTSLTAVAVAEFTVREDCAEFACTPQFSFLESAELFQYTLDKTLDEEARDHPFCKDLTDIRNFAESASGLLTTARSLADEKYRGVSLADVPFDCADYVALCPLLCFI